jgi:hypothetical protein
VNKKSTYTSFAKIACFCLIYLQQVLLPFAIFLITAETTKQAKAKKISVLSSICVTSNAAAISNNNPAPHKTDLTTHINLLSISPPPFVDYYIIISSNLKISFKALHYTSPFYA